MILIHIPAFWLGFFLFPVIAFIALSLVGFSWRQLSALKTWYIGLPIVQWPAMWLVVLGCKVLKTKKYCHFLVYNQRYWVSPAVDGFKVPDDAG